MGVHTRIRPDPDYSAQLLRSRIADAIDKLILALDRLDGDPDLEDGHDREAIDEREPEEVW